VRFANKSTIQSFTLLDLTLTFFDPQPPRFFLQDPTETKKTALLLQNQTQNWDFFRNLTAKTAIKNSSKRLQIWYSLKSTLPGSKISSCSGTKALLRRTTNPRFTLSLSLALLLSSLPVSQSMDQKTFLLTTGFSVSMTEISIGRTRSNLGFFGFPSSSDSVSQSKDQKILVLTIGSL
jgi:hypothetical protein